MYNLINITQPNPIVITQGTSSKGDAKIKNNQFLCSYDLSSRQMGNIEITLQELSAFNKITFDFNIDCLLEFSLFFMLKEGYWEKLFIVQTFKSDSTINLFLPLTKARKIQIVFFATSKEIIKKFCISNGIVTTECPLTLQSSSNYNRLWVPENLIDQRLDYGWASLPNSTLSAEYLTFDLQMSYYCVAICLHSIHEEITYFPETFQLELSNDGTVWQSILSESQLWASASSKYFWHFSPILARYGRLLFSKPENSKNYMCKILEIEIFTVAANQVMQTYKLNKFGFQEMNHASEVVPGTVRLATSNEVSPLKAVQANDARLRHATTEYPGIVQLAQDGMSQPDIALQSNDSRLHPASYKSMGIVKIARDCAISPGTVVESTDTRLQHATTKAEGIMRFAKDGDNGALLAIQSNDARLQLATTKYPGIVQLASDGVAKQGHVLQSNDQRLRTANIAWCGIVQLAQHNEVGPNKALQADDPRLNEGNEITKGRVQFAIDNEEISLKALQSNDSRLKPATEIKHGIVRFAPQGKKKSELAVQADDPRLEDSRYPLEHEHPYANKQHDLNDHSGYLNITASHDLVCNVPYTISNVSKLPFSVSNEQGISAGFIGGVVMTSKCEPALFASSNQQNSFISISKEAHACVLLSEKTHALHLANEIDGLHGSGKSLMVDGSSLFNHHVTITYGCSIAILWKRYSTSAFAEGDLLTLNEDGYVHKLANNHDSCIGILIKKPSLLLSSPYKKDMDHTTDPHDKPIQIAITGVVYIRIVGQVKAGSWVGYLHDEPGVARQLQRIQKQHGLAIALETNEHENEKLVSCLLK